MTDDTLPSWTDRAWIKSENGAVRGLRSRRDKAHNLKSRYPDRVPLICVPESPALGAVQRYMPSQEVTVGHLLSTTRKRWQRAAALEAGADEEEIKRRVETESAHGYYAFDRFDQLLAPATLVGSMEPGADGFVYMRVLRESTFGG